MTNPKIINFSNTPLIYSIIVTYNGIQWIDRCLNSLCNSTFKTHIIVIDNLSTDGTATYIKQHFPAVEFIQSKENLGFGKGNNIGLKKALNDKSDYVFLLNQDAWVEQDALEKIVTVHQNNKDYGILSPVHMNGANNGLETKFAEYASPDNTPLFLSDLYFKQLKDVYTTNFVNAAAWLISAKCLWEVGGFNPLFPHYGEDEEYIQRSHFRNFKVGIVPLAKITHDSVFSWEKIAFHPVRNIIFNLIPLADPGHRLRSAWLVFIKKSLDELSSLLLFRQFKKFKVRHTAFWKTIGQYNKIKKYRKLALEEHAFLTDNTSIE